jgi:hypothetical protein
VRRQDPFGAATFTTYEQGNANNVLGAGYCPALTAVPNYCRFSVTAGVAFTVQSLDSNLEVTY